MPGGRVRCAKDTGLGAFPPCRALLRTVSGAFSWALTCDILAFSQLLALTGTPARRWEPKTIRLRLMSIPAVIARHARRTVLRYKADHPWD